jgi:hypothetical protein
MREIKKIDNEISLLADYTGAAGLQVLHTKLKLD